MFIFEPGHVVYDEMIRSRDHVIGQFGLTSRVKVLTRWQSHANHVHTSGVITHHSQGVSTNNPC